VADRIGHANVAYTLAMYTHKSTGEDWARPKQWLGCTRQRVAVLEVHGRLHR
jgi:hypothetical protein